MLKCLAAQVENRYRLLALKGIILSDIAYKWNGEPKAEAEILVKTSPGTQYRKIHVGPYSDISTF